MGVNENVPIELMLCKMFPKHKFFVQNYFNDAWHTYPPGFEFAGDAKCFASDHCVHDGQPMRVVQILEDGRYALVLQTFGDNLL